MLQTLDISWREHLSAMDYLRQGIHLRGYAQKNPKQEYKRESFELFSQLLDKINYEVISSLAKFDVKVENEAAQLELQQRVNSSVQYQHQPTDALRVVGEAEPANAAPVVRGARIGRNDTCPCGSGKKYKQCHGQLN